MEFFVIIWFFCGVISAVIASNKGLSVFGWSILGLLFGPLGVILVLLIGKNQIAVEQSAIQSGVMKKCPYCAEIVKVEAIKCRFCGADISNYPSEPIPINNLDSSETLRSINKQQPLKNQKIFICIILLFITVAFFIWANTTGKNTIRIIELLNYTRNDFKLESFDYQKAMSKNYTKDNWFYLLKMNVNQFIDNNEVAVVDIEDSSDKKALVILIGDPKFSINDTIFVTARYLGTREVVTIQGNRKELPLLIALGIETIK